jgi:hypothetical protein
MFTTLFPMCVYTDKAQNSQYTVRHRSWNQIGIILIGKAVRWIYLIRRSSLPDVSLLGRICDRSTVGRIGTAVFWGSSKTHKSFWSLILDKARESCSCSQNFVRQSQVSACDLCTVPTKTSLTGNCPRVNILALEFFSI